MTANRKSKLWLIGVTVLATGRMLVLLQNFKTPEKVLARKVEHRFAVSDPQFRREMSVLLGPGIVRGNKVTALRNGNEIFPAMLLVINGEFATEMTAVFEDDLQAAETYSLDRWKSRPLREKFSEKILLPIRSQL